MTPLTPAQVQAARERVNLIRLVANAHMDAESVEAIDTLLAALDQAVEALKPFPILAAIPPIMVGRGENTHRAVTDADRYDHPRAISWGLIRTAAQAHALIKGEG